MSRSRARSPASVSTLALVSVVSLLGFGAIFTVAAWLHGAPTIHHEAGISSVPYGFPLDWLIVDHSRAATSLPHDPHFNPYEDPSTVLWGGFLLNTGLFALATAALSAALSSVVYAFAQRAR